MSFFDSIGSAFSDAANAVASGVTKAANAVASGVTGVANQIARGTVSAANSFAGGVESAGASAWRATSSEAQHIANSVESAGLVVSDGLMAGVDAAKAGVNFGAEKVVEGAVAVKEFVEVNACNIFVGSALSAVFVALAADGECEASTASIAAMAATGFADGVMLNTAAKALATLVAKPVSGISGVSGSGLNESQLQSMITFLIVKACKENVKLVVGSAGQFLVGILIYGITKLVCEGSLPGGYEVWRGANASL